IVMDIGMPGLDGIEATRRILAGNPAIKVVALSTYSDKRIAQQMMEAGAKGYVRKDAAPEELEQALRQTAQGGSFFSPEVTGTVMARLRGEARGTPAPTLSAREREVLQLVCEGHTNRDIGIRLQISHKTVDTHRSNLMHKLGIHDVAGLTRYALRIGLIS
ncbi:MAG: response regulator transcription factor, partial [Proteobacteria bacterium]|nr:response regulator transcription factor [Pseudomonadota bacterium]